LKKYPSAMAAPKETQARVAGEMFKRRGFADWAPFNPRLRADINRGEAGPQDQQAIPDFDTWKTSQTSEAREPFSLRPGPDAQPQQPRPPPRTTAAAGMLPGVAPWRKLIQPQPADLMGRGAARAADTRGREAIEMALQSTGVSDILPRAASQAVGEQLAKG